MAAKNTSHPGTIGKVLHYIRRYMFVLVLSILLAAVTVALTLYLPVLIGQAIDCILSPGHVDFSAMFPILWKSALIIAGTALAQWLMNI